MRGRCALALALLALPPAAAAAEVFRYVAVGDSITEGADVFDEAHKGGYPARLATRLGCNGSNCEVVNRGLGGEKSGEAVTRIDAVLAEGPWDVVLLMEGTNDVFQRNPVSNTTIRANLDTIANKSALQGADTLHASIIWFRPDGKWGTGRDSTVEDLRNKILALAGQNNRTFADAWSTLCPQGPDVHGHSHTVCFDRHYYVPTQQDPDPVGHPNASGFDMLADLFQGAIQSVAVPGAPQAVSPSGPTGPSPLFTWNRESPQRANWYEVSIEDGSGPIVDRWVESLDACSGSTCTLTLDDPLAGGDYTWRVRGRNVNGRSAWSASIGFEVFGQPPGTPDPLAPTGDLHAALPLSATYEWSAVGDATAYRLVVSDGSGTLLDETYPTGVCGGGTCAVQPALPLAAGSYSWRVEAQNPAGGTSSPLVPFAAVDLPLGTVDAVYPDRPIFNPRPTFRWPAVPGADQYDLEVRGPGGIVVQESFLAAEVCAGSLCATRASVDLAVGAYDWRVRVPNPVGSGPQGALVPFAVLACDPLAVQVENLVVNGVQQVDACESIVAGNLGAGDVVIGPGDVLILHAGQWVELRPGITITGGGRLVLLVDP